MAELAFSDMKYPYEHEVKHIVESHKSKNRTRSKYLTAGLLTSALLLTPQSGEKVQESPHPEQEVNTTSEVIQKVFSTQKIHDFAGGRGQELQQKWEKRYE